MQVTITKFRQKLFELVEGALRGERLQFTHKGVVFSVVPETKPAKLARLTRQAVVAPKADLDQDQQALFKELEAEWEKDWSEL